jgi:hypothetical protein
MSFLAVSQVHHSASPEVLSFFAICAGSFLAFVLLVAGAAHLANIREDRRSGRPDAYSYDDHDHPRSGSGHTGRPWEATYERRGYQPDRELADAEAASAERSAATSSEHTPLAVSPSNAKAAPDAAEERSPTGEQTEARSGADA